MIFRGLFVLRNGRASLYPKEGHPDIKRLPCPATASERMRQSNQEWAALVILSGRKSPRALHDKTGCGRFDKARHSIGRDRCRRDPQDNRLVFCPSATDTALSRGGVQNRYIHAANLWPVRAAYQSPLCHWCRYWGFFCTTYRGHFCIRKFAYAATKTRARGLCPRVRSTRFGCVIVQTQPNLRCVGEGCRGRDIEGAGGLDLRRAIH